MTATSPNLTGPPGERGRWRLTLHRRSFAAYAWPADTSIVELTGARSRRLELGWNEPAKLTFTVDGRSPAAAYIQELTTDVYAWRWDDTAGADRLLFRGVVAQSEDTVSEQSHAVNLTCHDYLAVMIRRFLTAGADLVYTATDQDDIVADLARRASAGMAAGNGTTFAPGSQLPLAVSRVNPDGTARAAKSGQVRDRTYAGQTSIGQAITDLAAVINGFDVDVRPAADTDGLDYLRVFYPSRGVGRTDTPLVYGSSVAAFTRSVNSSEYANYVRVMGETPSSGPQLYAEAWNADANDVGRAPVGLWMDGENASDVNQLATLQQKAAGDLASSGVLVPSYTLTLRPGWYRPGYPNLGDTVPLVLRTGRLDVSATVRVLGLAFAISDDGAGEDVDVTVGRPARTLTALFRDTRRDIDALARR
jgi:hypothetical protein